MLDSRITLREATPDDAPFLARLYRDTRRQEVAAWGWPPEQQDWFLRMQFDAQRRSYLAAFPDAVDHIICIEGAAVGRMLVAEEPAATHLVDIALLEEQRNHGIGSGLLLQLLRQCESQKRPLRLQVLQGNRAIRLYQRLGFVQTSADPMYVQMEWVPPQPLESP